MYLPAHFEERRAPLLQALMQAHPFATLVTLDGGEMNANHLPFDYDPEPAPFGTLRAHVARANPLWQDLQGDAQALVIFQGAHGYVSPSWYPSKAESHKVVPTYNYMVVQARGALQVIEDRQWLRGFVERLTQRFEAPRAQPWAVGDAPPDYIEAMLNAIVGIEIPVEQLVGKWKVSQNRSPADQQGVVDGFHAAGPQALADALAERMLK